MRKIILMALAAFLWKKFQTSGHASKHPARPDAF